MRSAISLFRLCCAFVIFASFADVFQLQAQERPVMPGISHIAVKVADVDKAIPFYRDFLGFSEEFRMNDPKDGSLKLVCMKVSDDQFIEILPGWKPGENHLHHISFRVEDAEAMRQYLKQSGVAVPDRVSSGKTTNAYFFVKDPDGYSIEFMQYLPDSQTSKDKGKFLPDARVSEHLTHPGVVVADVSKANHFYGDILGCKEVWRGSYRDDVVSWINVKMPESDDYIEYMLSPKTDAHFCLGVDDIAKAKAKLEASPYRNQYKKSFDPIIGKNNMRIINLTDPEGVRVELMELKTIDGKPAPSTTAPLPKQG